MPWWGWILVGAILLGSELFVTTEFYLVFLGVAAIVVGVVAAVFDLGVWEQWASFAVMAVVFLVGFRRRFFGWVGRSDGQVQDRMLGETATIAGRIEPGAAGSGRMRGSLFTVRNVGDTPLESGDRARVVEMDGLTLEVRRDP